MIEHPGIERLYQSWSDAFARKDVDAIFALLTDDYTLWMPGAPPVDQDALRPRLTAALAAYDLTPRFECPRSGCCSSPIDLATSGMHELLH